MKAIRVWLLALGLTACATGSGHGPALLLVTDAYELHLRDGRVFVLEDGAERPVGDYDELRALYRRDGAELPAAPTGESTTVLGWRDLTCVRAGNACGREPEYPARDLVRLRIRF